MTLLHNNGNLMAFLAHGWSYGATFLISVKTTVNGKMGTACMPSNNNSSAVHFQCAKIVKNGRVKDGAKNFLLVSFSPSPLSSAISLQNGL